MSRSTQAIFRIMGFVGFLLMATGMVWLGTALLGRGAQRPPNLPILTLAQSTPATLWQAPPTAYDAILPAPTNSILQPLDAVPLATYVPPNPQAELLQPTAYPTLFVYPTSPPFAGADEAGCAPEGLPIDGRMSQSFHRHHLGVDIAVPEGQLVFTTHSGTVTYADWSTRGYGYLVIVQSGAFITYYGHNSLLLVEVGQVLTKGQSVAYSGNSGNSDGSHVHYEIRLNDRNVNPLTFDARAYQVC
ncbi:MAG: M23 family metallopeptidase [Phototrophicaceae bacterium]